MAATVDFGPNAVALVTGGSFPESLSGVFREEKAGKVDASRLP